jgi:hypothetical protein
LPLMRGVVFSVVDEVELASSFVDEVELDEFDDPQPAAVSPTTDIVNTSAIVRIAGPFRMARYARRSVRQQACRNAISCTRDEESHHPN